MVRWKFKPRKTIASGNSLYISLPEQWVRNIGLKKGNLLEIECDDSDTCKLVLKKR